MVRASSARDSRPPRHPGRLGFTTSVSAAPSGTTAKRDRLAPSANLLAGPSRSPLSLLRIRSRRRSRNGGGGGGRSGFGGHRVCRWRSRLVGNRGGGGRARERRQLHRSRWVGRKLRPVLHLLVRPPERYTTDARSADDEDDEAEEQDRVKSRTRRGRGVPPTNRRRGGRRPLHPEWCALSRARVGHW